MRKKLMKEKGSLSLSPPPLPPLSLIHISEPTRRRGISYAVFCLKKIFLMIRRPPRSTPLYSSAASDVYKRQGSFLLGKALLEASHLSSGNLGHLHGAAQLLLCLLCCMVLVC